MIALQSMLSVHLGQTQPIECPLDGAGALELRGVEELERVAFALSNPAHDREYRLLIGNELIVPGTALLSSVEWGWMHYFESARGEVEVQLQCRAVHDESWTTRTSLVVEVRPSKVTEAQYQRMFDELRELAVGLVFDLVSKSKLSFGRGLAAGGLTARSSQLELHVIADLWSRIAPAVATIARAPLSSLQTHARVWPCWGSERLQTSSLAMLATRGEDPRREGARLPFTASRRILSESYDIAENRTVIWFLRFLERRAGECLRRAKHESVAIESDRQHRGELFDQLDRPRLHELDQALEAGRRVLSQVSHASRQLPFQDVRPEPPLRPTEAFRRLPGYRTVWREAINYLRTSYNVLDDDFQERRKPTWRMFEQWVFLQLAMALRVSGFASVGAENLLSGIPSADQRFSVDIVRDTTLCFAAKGERLLVVRYEPWIFARDAASARGDTLFRGRQGVLPWSPDIVLEVRRRRHATDADYEVESAIVLDAKYSKRATERHWDGVQKYFEVRSTATQEQVVEQVWLVVPGDGGITLEDPAVEWTPAGPSRRDRWTRGTIALGELEASSQTGDAKGAHPTMLEFVSGLFKHLNIVAP